MCAKYYEHVLKKFPSVLLARAYSVKICVIFLRPV